MGVTFEEMMGSMASEVSYCQHMILEAERNEEITQDIIAEHGVRTHPGTGEGDPRREGGVTLEEMMGSMVSQVSYCQHVILGAERNEETTQDSIAKHGRRMLPLRSKALNGTGEGDGP